MGKTALLLVAALAMSIILYSVLVNKNSGLVVTSYASYQSRLSARDANAAALEFCMRRLADSTTWFPDTTLSIMGGKVRVKLTSPVTITGGPYKGQTGVGAIAQSTFIKPATKSKSTYEIDTLTASVLVQIGVPPPWIRAAWTMLGPPGNVISQMFIDGRDHTTQVVAVGPPNQYALVPLNGVFGVATGAPTFDPSNAGLIGGTNRNVSPWVDITPSYPSNPNSISTNAYGVTDTFPKTPDKFMGWPEGTLMSMGKSGANGSRYLTRQGQLDTLVLTNQPLRGVTYIDVPAPAASLADTEWTQVNLPTGSGGIIVFHCSTINPSTGRPYTSYVKFIHLDTAVGHKITQVKTSTFQGLMIFDKVFHFHMNCVGAVAELTPFTTLNQGCGGNNDMTVAYCSQVVKAALGEVVSQVKGGWRSKLSVVQWRE